MVQRRVPRPSELAPLLRPAPWVRDRDERRLARAASIHDLREIARRRAPRAVFDYTDGAAEDEVGLQRAREAWKSIEFTPSVLLDVSRVDTGRHILGKRAAMPLALAPTGFTRMMHTEGERAVASVAADAGIPYTLSTMGTTTIEDMAAAAPEGRHWFQLYIWRDRAVAKDLVERAAAAGYDTLMLTVDTPVGGNRRRDVHNGLSIPPALSLKTFLDGARHPRWWFDLITTEPLTFASLAAQGGGSPFEQINKVFDPALTMDDVTWLRETWPGNLVIKGVQSVEDARRVVDAGADGVLLSNHGGRQLDRAPVPIALVEPVVQELGDDAEVLVDTGIMHGGDIVAAVALGARAAVVGRAYLYGLMAGGRAGVARAVDILRAEMERTMQLMGVTHVDDLRPHHARLHPTGDAPNVRAPETRARIADMGFLDKAKDLLGQHDDKVDQAINKAGDAAKQKYGHDGMVDKAAGFARERTGEGDTTQHQPPPGAPGEGDVPPPPAGEAPPPPPPDGNQPPPPHQ